MVSKTSIEVEVAGNALISCTCIPLYRYSTPCYFTNYLHSATAEIFSLELAVCNLVLIVSAGYATVHVRQPATPPEQNFLKLT